MKLLTAGRQPIALLTEGHKHDILSASWLNMMLDPETRRKALDRVKHVMSFHHFDAIAFSGLSGALAAPILAIELNKTLLCVRRKGESCDSIFTRDHHAAVQSHSTNNVEGDRGAKRYIIVDDFTSTGTTVAHIFDEVFFYVPHAQCIGVVEYMFPKTDLTPVAGRQHEKWDLDAKNIREAVTRPEFRYKREAR